jgi:DNA-binding CsgD family transcriptional regulator
MPPALAESEIVDRDASRLRLVRPAPSAGKPLPPLELLRAAAMRLDQTRALLREADVDRAIRLWEELIAGRWSLVDWFDTSGRRFIIGKLNPRKAASGTGLTRRERQVALCAALGESSKIIGYRLGISPSRVSALLKAAMRKLGVRTKVQLVIMVRVLNAHHPCTFPTAVAKQIQNA